LAGFAALYHAEGGQVELVSGRSASTELHFPEFEDMQYYKDVTDFFRNNLYKAIPKSMKPSEVVIM